MQTDQTDPVFARLENRHSLKEQHESQPLIHNVMLSMDPEGYVLVPYSIWHTKDSNLTRNEFLEELREHALKLDAFVPDHEARFHLFDRTTEYLKVYIDNYDAMCSYLDRQTDIDSLSRMLQMFKVKGLDTMEKRREHLNTFDKEEWRDRVITRLILQGHIPYDYSSYYETENDKLYSESRKARFDKIIDKALHEDMDKSSALVGELKDSESLPPRPQLPEGIRKAGIPLKFVEGLSDNNKEFLEALYKLYKERDPHALYPHKFLKSGK